MSSQQTTTPQWTAENQALMEKAVLEVSSSGKRPDFKAIAEHLPGHKISYVRQRFGSTARLLAKTNQIVKESLDKARQYKKQNRTPKKQVKPVAGSPLDDLRNALSQIKESKIVEAVKSVRKAMNKVQKATVRVPAPKSQAKKRQSKNTPSKKLDMSQ